MSLNANDSSVLFHFFAGTFHQDWSYDFKSWRDAVIDYVNRAGKPYGEAVLQALSRLLSEDLSDEQIEDRIIREFLCYESPGLIGESARVWLTQICEELKRLV